MCGKMSASTSSRKIVNQINLKHDEKSVLESNEDLLMVLMSLLLPHTSALQT